MTFSVGDKVRNTKEFKERYGYSLSGTVNMVHISEKNRLGRSHRVTLDEEIRGFHQMWLDPQYLELND